MNSHSTYLRLDATKVLKIQYYKGIDIANIMLEIQPTEMRTLIKMKGKSRKET